MNIHNGIKLIDNLIKCAMTFTTSETHQIVMDNKHLLPEYESGESGDGIGPRYCPSIFKKVIIFIINNYNFSLSNFYLIKFYNQI